MNLYLHATDVSLSISLQGIVATAVTYRVLDASGAELLAESATGFVAGDTVVAITVPAVLNTLAAGAYTDIRKVELKVVAADGTRSISELYAVEAADVLVEGVNSYQNYETAELTAMFTQPLEAWGVNAKQARIAALFEARDRISRLAFLESVDVPINELTAIEFSALSAGLRLALRKAQVAEADFILGGSVVDHKRDQGLMSETIGESSNMFRPGKPLELPVSKRTARILTGHITFAFKIGRA